MFLIGKTIMNIWLTVICEIQNSIKKERKSGSRWVLFSDNLQKYDYLIKNNNKSMRQQADNF